VFVARAGLPLQRRYIHCCPCSSSQCRHLWLVCHLLSPPHVRCPCPAFVVTARTTRRCRVVATSSSLPFVPCCPSHPLPSVVPITCRPRHPLSPLSSSPSFVVLAVHVRVVAHVGGGSIVVSTSSSPYEGWKCCVTWHPLPPCEQMLAAAVWGGL
jgi:hypothetical protein